MKRNNMPSQSLCVQPTFLIGTYDADGIANFTPITWISPTWNVDRYMLVISMFGSKQTKDNIAISGQLSANLVSTDMLELLDYLGSRSGRDGAKDALPYAHSEGAVCHAPTLDRSRFVYECEVAQVVATGDSDTYFCDIRNVQVDETVDLSDGIDLTALDPVVYSGHYHSIGLHLGKIGDFHR